ADDPALSRDSWGSGARSLSHFDQGNARERVERVHHGMGRWFRAQFMNSPADRAWAREAGLMGRSMSEGVFASGGAPVPSGLANEIVVLADQHGVARRVCRVWPMNSASLQIPREASEVSASFVGENTTIPDSQPGFDQVSLTAKSLSALIKISRSLAEDAIP